MSKRILVLIFTIVLALNTFAPAVFVRAFDEDYGKEAWECLQYIDEHLGERLSDARLYTDTKNHDAAGAWIKSKLESYGYNVNVLKWVNEGTDLTTYYVRRPGRSEKRIVVGAHYDCVETKGVEDNGTGVSVLLELAKRFADYECPLTVDFCFFDAEETMGYSGSYMYLDQVKDIENIMCYLNIDCVGAGDTMFAYGGIWEDGELKRTWPLYMAMDGAYKCGRIPLNYIPKEVNDYWPYPTRTGSSDHWFFNLKGVPYVYFECNAWITPDGKIGNPEKPQLYNSSNPAYASTNGQIIHLSQWEDLKTLESIAPGRIKTHMSGYSEVITWMLRFMDETSPGLYQHPIEHAEPTTEAPTEARTTAEPTTEAPTQAPTTAEPTTEAPTEAPTTEGPITEAPTTEAPKEDTTTVTPAEEPTTETPTTKAPETTETPGPGQRDRDGLGLGGYIAIAGGVSLLLIIASILLQKRR